MKCIIKSMLDDDLYKFTQQQCVFHQYPKAEVQYAFKCRNKGVKLGFLVEGVREQIEKIERLRIADDELDYLRSLGFFKDDYLTYLKNYQYNSKQDASACKIQ